MMTPLNVSIIIPAHNEEGTIKKTVEQIIKYCKVPNYEILICNDHSKDKTRLIGKSLEKKYASVKLLDNANNKGFGNVIRFGFSKAKGKYVVPMMADLCDDPKTLNDMYNKLEEGYDVVVASRYVKQGKKKNVQNIFKSSLSNLAGILVFYIKGVKTKDSTNAFKMMRRSCLKKIKLESNNFDLSLELTIKLHKKGAKIYDVPTTWIDRSDGKSKFKLFKVLPRYIKWLGL